MNEEKKILIYPFDVNLFPVLRYRDMIKLNWNIVSCVSPIGWGINKDDIRFFNNDNHVNILFNDNFDSMLCNCDSVWFCESDKSVNFDDELYPNIIKAINEGKDIITSCDLKNSENNIITVCKEFNVKFTNLLKNYSSDFFDMSEALRKIETPVIAVASLTQDLKKFDVQLALRKYFKAEGYRVSQIGTKSYSEIFGFHSMPNFMYNNEYDEKEKIVMFNTFIKQIEHIEAPDVIIIGIPGGIMPICDGDINNFGVKAFEISRAVVSDITILNMPFDFGLETENFMNLKKVIFNKFEFDVKCFNIANKAIDGNKMEENNIFSLITIDDHLIEEIKAHIRNTNEVQVYSIINEDDMKDLPKYIIDTLAGYADITVM